MGCSDIWPNKSLSKLSCYYRKDFCNTVFQPSLTFCIYCSKKIIQLYAIFLLLFMAIKIQEYLDCMKLFHYLFHIIIDGYQLTTHLFDSSGYSPNQKEKLNWLLKSGRIKFWRRKVTAYVWCCWWFISIQTLLNTREEDCFLAYSKHLSSSLLTHSPYF